MDIRAAAQATALGVSQRAFERQVFAGLDDGGMNACVACCDRWVDGRSTGLTMIALDGTLTSRTFDALQSDAARFANLLTARGVCPGDVVASLLPRGPEKLTVILGTWRAGAVYQPIFTGLGVAAIEARINHTGRPPAKLIVTDAANRPKPGAAGLCPPVLVVTDGESVGAGDGDFRRELGRQSAFFAPVSRGGDDPFVLLVGGHGGAMRPVLPPLRSLLSVQTSIRVGVHPREPDIGWDVADPASFSDLYFTVLCPLLQGDAATSHESDRMTIPAVTPGVKAELTRRAGSREFGQQRLRAA
jgi:acetyl-CoA synthetase